MGSEGSINNDRVIIIGGGPTGLSLGLGLARQGVRSVILEKKEEISRHSKAPVIHQRTREIFRQWEIEKEFLKAGKLIRKLKVCKANSPKALFDLDFTHLEKEARDPGMLVLEQNKTEKILLQAIEKTDLCTIYFNNEVINLEQDPNGVAVCSASKEGEKVFHGKYIIGCDGASSFARDRLDLPFKGKTYNVNTVLADVRPGDERNNLPWPRFFDDKNEVTIGIKISNDLWRLIHLESGKNYDEEKEKDPAPAEVDKWVKQVLGEGEYEQVWASPFNIHRRASPSFRKGRIVLAGDAAHVHSPVGGQGMNAGIQDAHNLAWKLAAVIKEKANDDLLDSYEKERMEAVVEEVSGNTDFLTKTFLQSPGFIRKTAFFFLRRILSIPFLRDKFLRRAAMINIGYKDSGIVSVKSKEGGKRLPNVLLYVENDKAIRIYDKLAGKTMVIKIGAGKEISVPFPVLKINKDMWDRSGLLQKILFGKRGWILVRPDMHIAWAGHNEEEFRKILHNWKGE